MRPLASHIAQTTSLMPSLVMAYMTVPLLQRKRACCIECVPSLMPCVCCTTPYDCAIMHSSLQHMPTNSTLCHHNTKLGSRSNKCVDIYLPMEPSFCPAQQHPGGSQGLAPRPATAGRPLPPPQGSPCSGWHSYQPLLPELGRPPWLRHGMDPQSADHNYHPANCFLKVMSVSMSITVITATEVHSDATGSSSLWPD